jgi:hypothetical protein
MSTNPGATTRPDASIVRAEPASRFEPISATAPSRTRTSATSSRPEAGSITRPPEMRNSLTYATSSDSSACGPPSIK